VSLRGNTSRKNPNQNFFETISLSYPLLKVRTKKPLTPFFMKKFTLLPLFFFLFFFSGCGKELDENIQNLPTETPEILNASVSPDLSPSLDPTLDPVFGSSELSIEVAILLDTSSSMNGLIDQTKSQLWKMINEFGKAKDQNGETPRLKISLYEYGNSNLSPQENYIRQISPFTSELDVISEQLFSLKTNGGSEYAGAVIEDAVKKLEWSDDSNNLRIVLIAGNEPFTQGPINYKESIANARNKDVIVNTIFCGNYEEGVQTEWKNGALLGGGQYFNIDQDQKVIHIDAPQDEQILRLNEKLNKTYFGYGEKGKKNEMRQEEQDSLNEFLGSANLAERAISKSSQNYVNDSWDIVEGVEKKVIHLEDLEEEDLPEEMKGMTPEEMEIFIAEQLEERKKIQSEIQKLSVARSEYIEEERKKLTGEDNTIDSAINKIIFDQVKEKGLIIQD
jgi:hypothetical protein